MWRYNSVGRFFLDGLNYLTVLDSESHELSTTSIKKLYDDWYDSEPSGYVFLKAYHDHFGDPVAINLITILSAIKFSGRITLKTIVSAKYTVVERTLEIENPTELYLEYKL